MPMRIITFKAEEDLIEKIDLLAKMLGETRSDIIRTALTTYIAEIEKNGVNGKKNKSILAITKII